MPILVDEDLPPLMAHVVDLESPFPSRYGTSWEYARELLNDRVGLCKYALKCHPVVVRSLLSNTQVVDRI